VTVRELADLDAAELSWNCVDDVESQPTIYVVESTSTSRHYQPVRRQLHSTDAVDTAATWRIVTEVSLHRTVCTIHISRGFSAGLFLAFSHFHFLPNNRFLLFPTATKRHSFKMRFRSFFPCKCLHWQIAIVKFCLFVLYVILCIVF